MEREPAKAKEMLRKIATESATVMENIGDIVWSMKTGSQQGLDERVKNFVADVLGAANIQYTIFVEDGIEESIRNVEAKRNILLIIKEAVNNVVRYSKASNAAISIKRLAGQVCVQIADDGIGFNRETARNKGNGLFNMQKRTIELDGVYEIISRPGRGTTVSALFPPTKISDSA
jgi:signal transduction histidine kinase